MVTWRVTNDGCSYHHVSCLNLEYYISDDTDQLFSMTMRNFGTNTIYFRCPWLRCWYLCKVLVRLDISYSTGEDSSSSRGGILLARFRVRVRDNFHGYCCGLLVLQMLWSYWTYWDNLSMIVWITFIFKCDALLGCLVATLRYLLE